ncbi:MAG: GNAT family N-acetyltransferase [Nakamurella sp.]
MHEAHVAKQSAGVATYLIAWRGIEPLGSGVIQWNGYIGSNGQKAFPAAVEFNLLHVRENFRGEGVGGELVRAAEELARNAGIRHMCIAVADTNPGAERLYIRLGYRPTGVFDVSKYEWVDDDGRAHRASDRDQLLVKVLESSGTTDGDLRTPESE